MLQTQHPSFRLRLGHIAKMPLMLSHMKSASCIGDIIAQIESCHRSSAVHTVGVVIRQKTSNGASFKIPLTKPHTDGNDSG